MKNGLYSLRKRQHKLTLSEIAEPLGVSTSTIWRWEHGVQTPPSDKLTAYAKLLKVSVKTLLTVIDEEAV